MTTLDLTRPASVTAPAPACTRTTARAAGLGYVAIFVLAIAANTVVSTADLPAVGATPEPALALRLAAAGFVVLAVVDVLVAWALHLLVRPVSPDVSALAAGLRAVHAVLMGAGAAVLLSLGEQAFSALWMAGLLFFGGHLVLLAGLLRRVGVHRGLVLLLRVAGAAYAVDTVLHLTLADYDAVAAVMLPLVALPSVLGEGWLTIWLLRGGPHRRAATA